MDEKKEDRTTNEDADLSQSIAASQSSISSLRLIAETLQGLREQNATVLAEIAKADTVHRALAERIADSVRIVTGFSKAINAQVNLLPDLSKVIHFPAYESLLSANLAISNLFGTTDTLAESIAQLSVSEKWQTQLQSVSWALESIQVPRALLDSHIAQISQLSVLAQASLYQLPWDRIGDAIQVSLEARNVVQRGFLDLTQAYSSLFHSLGEQPSAIVSLPPFASRLPAVEFFNEISILESITTQDYEDIELVEQKREIRLEIQRETSDRLVVLLAELNQNLVSLLEGARFSLESDHSDRARHFAVSLRELFTYVLHALAPDSEVEKWTDDPRHYHNKRPTRRARLLYICRNVNHGSFTKFFATDIEAVLNLVDLFQGGTHEIVVGYTTEQLNAMLVRMESVLRFMLEIGHSEK